MAGLARPDLKVFVSAGILVALILAGFLSYYASAQPDGLTKVAGDIVPGIAVQEKDHARAESVFAGYGTEGVESARLSGAIAGVVGVAITLTVAGLVFVAARRRDGSAGAVDTAEGASTRTPRQP